MRLRRPIGVARGVPLMQTDDFLQEHDVGRHAAHRIAQFVQHETAIELSEALVGVEGQQLQRHSHGSARMRKAAGPGFTGLCHDSTGTAFAGALSRQRYPPQLRFNFKQINHIHKLYI